MLLIQTAFSLRVQKASLQIEIVLWKFIQKKSWMHNENGQNRAYLYIDENEQLDGLLMDCRKKRMFGIQVQ